ncbi:MAG: UDP-N-acetylmuramoyl-tripeptide--D-alanyl-D-alanine ligase [Acidobacteria bacterium]|nr:UDP-N-acetylmuramoyl-tripeptide--D-alanyl-D-alanine ligase [Acidobacteriota bacterium]
MTAVALATTLTLAEVLAGTGGVLAPDHARSGGQVLSGVSIDSRTIRPGELFVAIRGPRFDGHDFVAPAARGGAAAALVHRDVDAPAELPLVRVEHTTRALGALAHHVRRQATSPVVGITGSVGKTTTKDLAAGLLETRGPVLRTAGNLNNEYGLPLTLLGLREEHTAAVLEMGMSAPGELRTLSAIAEPDVAVITRVAPVHLEFFPSVDAIADAKAEILEGLRPGGTAVLNGDDPRLRRLGEGWDGRVVWFGRDRRHDVSAERWRGTVFGMRFDLRIEGRTVDVGLPLAGPHFVEDFLAAAAAAHVLGVTSEAMAEAAASLAPARHRGEVRQLAEGVTLIDDSYNSSPEALEASVVALTLAPARRRVAVLGDMLELGATAPELHRESGRTLAGRVDVVAGVGPLAKEIVAGAREAGLDEKALVHFDDATLAAAAVGELVQPGDAVLVKASRGIQLERVVTAIAARFGGGEA